MLKKLIAKIARKILFLPLRLKGKIVSIARVKQIIRFLDSTSCQKQIILLGTPEHGNIGDLAIAFAEKEFFKTRFPDFCFIEIPSQYISAIPKNFASNGRERIFCVHGGGFLGNLWISEEIMFRKVLKIFKNERIVVFPQSIFFEKTKNWELDFQNSKSAYSAHPNLHVFIRDKSVDFMREKMMPSARERVYSAPDIVLSLDRSEPKFERAGALLVFRQDKEKSVAAGTLEHLEAILRSRGLATTRTDTVVNYGVPAFAREFEVEQKFDEFRRSRIIITDRLHGMIFATITGTPCIALNNSSGKVEGVYSLWLRDHFPYIKFAQNLETVPALLDELLKLPTPQRYNPAIFEERWQKITEILRGNTN